MKFLTPTHLGAALFGILSSFTTLADDHMLNGMNIAKPFNVQANLCKLNPGVSEEDYDEKVEDYFEWAKKNSVEPVFVRQKPLFSHAMQITLGPTISWNFWPWTTTSVGANLGTCG